MKKFIFKLSVFLLSLVAVNSLVGWMRFQKGDTITYSVNYRKKFINENTYKGWTDTQLTLPLGSVRFDMSKEIFGRILHKRFDENGFSNMVSNTEPDILLIGDSFFDDPYLSTDSGLQARINKRLGRNAALNIGAMGCSGLSAFQELKRRNYFKSMPKLIIMEVIERNANSVLSNLKSEIDHPAEYQYKNCYLDFALGNNLSQIYNSSLFSNKSIESYGSMHVVDNKKIWFYRNQLSREYLSNLDTLMANLSACQTFFKSQGSEIVFVIAPDKESIYKSVFPGSSLPELNKKMQEKGIGHIDVYSLLMSQDKPESYYFEGDTHWNEKALDLLINEILKYRVFLK